MTEFGIDTKGLEPEQKERPKIGADGGRTQSFPGQQDYAQFGNEHLDGEEPLGYGSSN